MKRFYWFCLAIVSLTHRVNAGRVVSAPIWRQSVDRDDNFAALQKRSVSETLLNSFFLYFANSISTLFNCAEGLSYYRNTPSTDSASN
jgi:hypothetical protein